MAPKSLFASVYSEDKDLTVVFSLIQDKPTKEAPGVVEVRSISEWLKNFFCLKQNEKKNTENYEPGSINDFRRNTFCLILEYCEWCNIKQFNFQQFDLKKLRVHFGNKIELFFYFHEYNKIRIWINPRNFLIIWILLQLFFSFFRTMWLRNRSLRWIMMDRREMRRIWMGNRPPNGSRPFPTTPHRPLGLLVPQCTWPPKASMDRWYPRPVHHFVLWCASSPRPDTPVSSWWCS